MRNIAINSLLVIASIVIFLVIFEIVMKFAKPYTAFGAGTELRWMRQGGEISDKSVFTIDPNFGFRPNLGNKTYNEYGTHVNEYKIEKNKNKKRLLFVGDSVTSRGKIIKALKDIYGESKYEYWNGGVESFNTIQEVKFYKEYHSKIKPDHVILTFHNNDFSATPIAFINKDKKLVVYTPYTPLRNMNPWLYKHSSVYRLYFRITTAWKSKINEDIVNEVKKYMADLKDSLEKDNITFSVVLLPLLNPYDTWTDLEKKSRESAIKIFTDLGIEYYDLFGSLNQAIDNKVTLHEKPGDTWHPSDDVSKVFAKHLKEKQLLP